MVEIDGLVIPGFYIENQDLAVLVAEELKLFGILDVFVFSKDAESIIAAREIHSLIRGVLIFDFIDQEELTVEDLLDVRRETNRAQALAAVLPVDLVSRGQVEYLQQRLMTIWVQAADNDVSQYRAILSGAQGIITQNYENLFAKYELFPENTQVRRPMMIAHRGLYAGALSSAPENTIEAALASVEKGADILELDVYLTSDHEIVIIHDGSTARTAPDYTALTVSSSTLAQLKEVNLADPVSGRLDLKIPTLNEYFDALKGSGAVIFIEIKSVDSMLVHLVSLLIEEYDMYDQAVMISFGTQNIIDMNELYPDLSNGLLTSSVLNANSVPSSLTNAISTVVPIKSTLNTSYGALTSEFIKSVIHRGITVWPWTLNDYTELNSYYGYGVNGITTDNLGYYENTFNRINVKEYPGVVTWENRLTVKIETELQSPNGTTYAYRPEYIMIDDGGTGVVFDEYGKIESIEQPGILYMYATFDSYLPDGTKITVLTDIIEVEILAEVVEEPSSLGLIIGISSGVLLLAAGTFVFITIKKRRVII
ncbi:MAG TPA: hypothetical protein DEP70_01670 [Acholeplasmataceae bacterium]|nr:hypothetical protein [Acholeplasmataceae bacterium]